MTSPESGWSVLRRRSDFQRTYRTGRRWNGEIVRLFVVENDGHGSRVGITVTRKSGNAVRRNRLRRQIREAMRDLVPSPPLPDRDLVVHVRPGVESADYRQLSKELAGLVRRGLSAPARPR